MPLHRPAVGELMHRIGHGTVRAALIYQHAADDRDRQIADALGALVTAQRKETGGKGVGDAPSRGMA